MHRAAPLSLRPRAPGTLTETAQTGSLRLLPRARRLPWKPLIVAPAPRSCFVSAGSGCNERSTSFRVPSQWAAYFVAAFFIFSLLALLLCCFYNAAYKIRAILPQPSYCNRQHDAKSQTTSNRHFLKSSDVMPLKTKRAIDPAIDSFDTCAFVIKSFPFVA